MPIFEEKTLSINYLKQFTRENLKVFNTITIKASIRDISPNAFYNPTSIIVITVKEGIGIIKDSAFSGLSNLIRKNIPNGSTYTSMEAFYRSYKQLDS